MVVSAKRRLAQTLPLPLPFPLFLFLSLSLSRDAAVPISHRIDPRLTPPPDHPHVVRSPHALPT